MKSKESKFLPHLMAVLLAATMLVAPLPAQADVGSCRVTTSADNLDVPPSGSLRECSLLIGEAGFENGIDISFSVQEVELVAPVVFASPMQGSVSLTGPVAISPADSFTAIEVDGLTMDRLLTFFNGDVWLDRLEVVDSNDGSVYAQTDSLSVFYSTFSRNRTSSTSVATSGGAIYSTGDVQVEHSNFSDNEAYYDGGAIYTRGNLDIYSSSFIDNEAGDDGGAVWSDINVYIDTSHFEGNGARYYGGAALATQDLIVTRSSFVANYAGTFGGAIIASTDEDGDESHIFHSTFYYNGAGMNGGAVYQQDEDVSILFSTFVDNFAQSNGSAVYTSGEDAILFASIFADSSEPEVSQISTNEDVFDFGGNLMTQSVVLREMDTLIPLELGFTFDPIATAAGIEYGLLGLGELTELSNGTFAFIPAADSAAGDLVDAMDIEPILRTLAYSESNLDYEELLGYLQNESGGIADQSDALVRGRISAGSIDFDTEPQPVNYTGPVVTNDPETSQSGSTVTYRGSDLDEVTSATIAGQPALIVSKSASALTLRVPAGLTQGMHDVVLSYGTTESITLQNGLVVQDLMKVWTQLQSDNTVKMYAKNIVGEGKIQFFHNNNEIAWVKASNALNPKLRQSNGSSYLVRTRELVAGKNAFEIYQDGTRIWRAAYAG